MPLDTSSSDPSPAPEAYDPHALRALLGELIEIGAERIRLAHQLEQARIQAELARLAADPASPPSITPADELQSATAYQRRFRAVRMGMLLAERLANPAPAQDRAEAQRSAAKRTIQRALEDEIHDRWRGESAERLHQEVLDRLDSPEIEEELGVRPHAEIIANIRRDIYINVPPGTRAHWRRRTPEDIAELHARAARPPATTPAPRHERALWPHAETPANTLPDDPAEAVAAVLQRASRLPGG